MVLLGADRLRQQRETTVGPHHHVAVLDDRPTTRRVPTDAGDAPVVELDLVDGEGLADLDTALRRRVDEELVEHRPPGAVGDRRVRGPRGTGERERSEVEAVGVDGRAVGGAQSVEHAPPVERGDPRRVDDVRRERVAREGRPIDEEHRWPWRASSMAVGEPAQRAPMTMTSYRSGAIALPPLDGSQRPGTAAGASSCGQASASAAARNAGMAPSQPAVFARRNCAPSAPRRSHPECTISSRVVPSPSSTKDDRHVGGVLPGRGRCARGSRAACGGFHDGDLAPVDLGAVGRALEDAPAEARLERHDGVGIARRRVALRPPRRQPGGPHRRTRARAGTRSRR